jgi:hypothetical protein
VPGGTVRYYSPDLGQFISPDTLVPDPSNVQAYNRYMYALGNPLRYNDPSGHWIETALDIVSLGATVKDINDNGLNWQNGIGLVADVGSLVLPGVAGGGAAVRYADEAYAAGKAGVNAAWDWGRRALGYGDEAAQYGDDAVDATKTIGDCLTNSFSAETLVMTARGLRPISELIEGDLVLAWDEATGKTGYFAVTDTISHVDPEIVLLTLDSEMLETTADHPFYVVEANEWSPYLSAGKWIDAGDLQVGDDVRQADGTAGEVRSVRVVAQRQPMYNLTVDTAHTFFVGESQWLVHNCDFAVVQYGVKVTDMNNHHGIMDAWATANLKGYVSRASGAPTVQMGVDAHKATTQVFRDWLTENYGRPVGVKVDWAKVSWQEIHNLSERMFDAAGVPRSVREQYYSALDRYLATGQWE